MKTYIFFLFLGLLGFVPGALLYCQQQSVSLDSVQAENNQYLTTLRASIAGKEGQLASEMFENIRIMTNVPAGRLLNIMNLGYSRSLGVSCVHCHVPNHWEIDDKPAKRTAREMSKMVKTINQDLLRSIADLKSENPTVNCTTCHRGQLKPALDLPR
jgi:hypothetical protein